MIIIQFEHELIINAKLQMIRISKTLMENKLIFIETSNLLYFLIISPGSYLLAYSNALVM